MIPSGLSITAVLGHSMERTGRLLHNFPCCGIPPAEWGNQLKLLTRKTERSLEGEAYPSKPFPSPQELWGLRDRVLSGCS